MIKTEFRFAALQAAEDRTLTGLALPYETETRIGNARERFTQGAARSSGDAILNVAHDRARFLAREPLTLKLESTDAGLTMHATLPETREADDTLTLIKSNVLRGLSVEFRANRERNVNGVRVIEDATINGLAVVARAAYGTTHVDARGEERAAMLAAELAELLQGDPRLLDSIAAAEGMIAARLLALLRAISNTLPDTTPRQGPANRAIETWML